MFKKILAGGLLLLLTLIGMIMPISVSGSTLACSASASSQWQTCGPVESVSSLNSEPNVIQANDGTLRMTWLGIQGSNSQILYADRLMNGTWNPGTIVASQSGNNEQPALAQLTNGTLYVFFAYKAITSQHHQLYYIKQNGGTFSKYTSVPLAPSTSFTNCTLNGCNDTLPAASVGKDGRLWLVWTRDNSTRGTGIPVMRQLWYKTLQAGAWSTEQPLTSANDVNWNYQPSVMVGKDGTARIVYSIGQSSSGVFQIYYATYTGTGWSTPAQLTSQTSAPDGNPSIMQDRNGTLWTFWNRNLNEGSSGFAEEIYARSSVDDGATWTPESALTSASCSSSGCVQNENPTGVQSTLDKYIWIFFASDPVSNLNIYTLQTATCISGSCTPRQIAPVHDMTISFFTANASIVYEGGFHNPYANIFQSSVVQVLATITNPGDYNETVTVSLKATNTTSYSLSSQIIQVQAGSSGIAAFNFDTTGVKPARYGLYGNATIPVEPLGNRQDGLLSSSNQIHVLPLGDVDQDGSVTITDVSVVFYNYGCRSPNNPPLNCQSRPNDGYNPWADVDGKGVIDVVDVAVVSKNYGTYT